MQTRKQIIGTYTLKILIALLILVVGGFLYLRVDASRDKSYSLSAQSKKTIREHREPVVVKVFATNDLTPQMSVINRGLKDLLAEFARQSKGRLKYEYVRAASNDALIKQAVTYGIEPYTVMTTDNEQQVTKEIVLGASFEGGGKTTALTIAPGMENMMEYLLVQQLQKLEKSVLPKLLVFADSLALMFQYGSHPNETGTFFHDLSESFQIEHTQLLTPPKEFTPVMFCLGVIDSLSAEQSYNLDQYLMQGGKLVMCQDRVAAVNTPQGLTMLSIPSNMFRQLEHYGIYIKPNVVLDRDCEIRQGAGLGTQAPYPFFPFIKPNEKYAYTTGFDTIFMYFASELATVPGSKIKMQPVLKTSPQSNVLEGPSYNLDLAMQRGLDPSFLNQPPRTVAAEYSGKLTSFCQPKPGDNKYQGSVANSQIILFGDSELPMDFGAGAFIVMNAIDHLLGREDMVKLRSPRRNMNQLGVGVYMNKRGMQPSEPEQTARKLTLGFQLMSVLIPLALLALFAILRGVRRAQKESEIDAAQ